MLINLKVEFDECEPLEYSCDENDIKNINWSYIIETMYEEYLENVEFADTCEDEKFTESQNDKLK